MLWTAIAWLQREDPNVISLVYSGDYPAASKEEILAKVDDRFSIKLSPTTIEFVPLPSRYLVGDTHWKRFTLLGQTLGSIYIAWEGLCGPDGVWGDIFIGRYLLCRLADLRLYGLRLRTPICAPNCWRKSRHRVIHALPHGQRRHG